MLPGFDIGPGGSCQNRPETGDSPGSDRKGVFFLSGSPHGPLRGAGNIGNLAGKTVRLVFQMQDAKLFAFQFVR